MKSVLLPVLACITMSLTSAAQSAEKPVSSTKANKPLFFVDSVRITADQLENFKPEDIASVTVYKDKKAKELLGEDGKDGVVYIETKQFSKTRYWNCFRVKSQDYAHAVPDVSADSTVQYIVNGKLLKENIEGELSSIDNSNIQSISIISKEELQKQFGINDKKYGVVIKAQLPPDSDTKKKKFKMTVHE